MTLNYSKGVSWINDVRIPFVDGGWGNRNNKDKNLFGSKSLESNVNTQQNSQGRFPANLLVSDDMLNDGTISKGKVNMTQQSSKNNLYKINSKGNTTINDGVKDKGTNSRYYDLDRWWIKLLEDVE